MEQGMYHFFILNPKSFHKAREMDLVISSIKSYFKSLNQDNYKLHISRFPRNAIGAVRVFIAGIPENSTVRVYAVGGDGILFDCLNSVAGIKNAELAVMPFGVTNNFVRSFGEYKKSFFRNIQFQANAETTPTDIIRCGGNYALNFCCIGMESDAIVKAMKINRLLDQDGAVFRRMHRCLYKHMYYLGGFLAAFNKKIIWQHYDITIDGELISGNFRSINIANGPCYGENKNAVITAVPNDGMLDILIGKSAGAFRILALVHPYVKGRYHKFPSDFILKRGKQISIRSDAPLMINMDDEIFFDTSFTAEIIPGGVKIASPCGFTYEKKAEFHDTK
jgi:diacylglycerol kinase family enzyme